MKKTKSIFLMCILTTLIVALVGCSSMSKYEDAYNEYEEKFKQIRFIEWIKTNPVPINSSINYLTNAREIALTGVKQNKPIFHSKYDNGIYQYPIYQGKDRIHPTQKPLNLFIELLQKHSNVGDVVLDTFAGSGTTPVACLKTNRQFYGCELDTNYYNQALKRINDNKN